jgi:hypothetical protein
MDSADNLLHRLKELNEIGIALSREKDLNCLLEAILVAAKLITNVDGGTLYRMHGERELRFEIMRTDSSDMRWAAPAACRSASIRSGFTMTLAYPIMPWW